MKLGRVSELENKGDSAAINNEDSKMEDMGRNPQIPCLLLLMVFKGRFYQNLLTKEGLEAE